MSRVSRRWFSTGTAPNRSVLIAGMRTPFCKSYGVLMREDSTALGASCVSALINKTNLDVQNIDEIIWGNVVLTTSAPNIGREININLNLPRKIVAHQVSMACSSGLKAITDADSMIKLGYSNCIIAGGSDSLSYSEIPLPTQLSQGLAMTVFGGAKTLQGKLQQFWKHSGPAAKWLPTMPSVAEKSTGKTMGYHADFMAELHGITREQQDEFAMQSHIKAQSAKDRGIFDEEIAPMKVMGRTVRYDNFLQTPDPQKMAKLKAAFRKPGGTITAANATGLTDGGSAVLLTSEQYAKEHGLPADITIRAWQNSAIDPWPQLLIAPAIAIIKVLDKAGLTLDDIDVFELHEAFAAQVLCTLSAIKDPEFCNKYVDGHKPLGDIDMSKLNVNGGSLAIGHPFAATGGRCVTAAMNELRRSKKRYALVSICAAGGIGSTAILERLDELSVQPSQTSL